MQIGLLVTLYDEHQTVGYTLENIGLHLAAVALVQSGRVAYPALEVKLAEIRDQSHQTFMTHYEVMPNLAAHYSRWELPAQAICRNYSHLFTWAEQVQQKMPGIDYWLAITGDTLIFHLGGIRAIIARMERDVRFQVGVSKAYGNQFHRADFSLDELKQGQGGGRPQGADCPDFQPQLFIVHRQAVPCFKAIPVINRWTSEECLGACVPLVHQFDFGPLDSGWFIQARTGGAG